MSYTKKESITKHAYLFDTDDDFESFTNVNLGTGTVAVTGGSIVMTAQADNTSNPSILQAIYAVDAIANAFMHFVYKNESENNNQIRFQYRTDDKTTLAGTNISIVAKP